MSTATRRGLPTEDTERAPGRRAWHVLDGAPSDHVGSATNSKGGSHEGRNERTLDHGDCRGGVGGGVATRPTRLGRTTSARRPH